MSWVLTILVAVLIVVLSLIVVIALDHIWSLETIDDKLPTEVFYSEMKDRILSGDFGTVAERVCIGNINRETRQFYDEEYYWVCDRVDAYGPFDYGGKFNEITLDRSTNVLGVTTTDNTWSFRKLCDEVWYVNFCQCEDGVWMIVKQFVRDGVTLESKNRTSSSDDRDDLQELAKMIENGDIPYEITEFSVLGDANEELRILSEATDRILSWKRASDGGYYYEVAQ